MAELNIDDINNELEGLARQLKGSNTAFDDTIKKLVDMGKMTKAVGDAKKQEYQQIQKEIQQLKYKEDREKKYEAWRKETFNTLVSFSKGMGQVNQSLYNAKDAFTSVTPALDLMSDTFQKIIEAGGEALSGISLLGFSFGNASKGVAKFANTAIDLATTIAKEQLQYAQNITNSFRDIGAAGITFGGSITDMTNAAANSGQTLNRMTEFITKNNAVLSQLGGNMAQNATDILRMSRAIGLTNSGLLVSYGSYEALNDGIAQYVGLQQRLGYVDMNNQKAMTQGATDYLVRQRELTAITGKQAAQLVEEEKQRRSDLGYALKMSRLSDVQQKNVETTMQIAGKIGPEAQAYIKEYFESGGNIVKAENIRFAEMQGVVADTLKETLAGATSMDAEAFKENTGKVLSANAPALEAFARSMEELSIVNKAAMNPIITSMTNTASGILQNMNFFKDATELFKTLKPPKGGDAKTEAAADAINKMVSNQQELDKLAAASILRMSAFVDAGFLAQKAIIGMSDATADLLAAITQSAPLSKILELAEQLLKTKAPEISLPSKDAPNMSIPLPAMPTKASGGVTNGPSIAGEDGPEAVIPLSKGAVPLDIDWTPMIRIMSELLAATEEGNDVRERLLKASY
jgi:hypothetical protein